jgi:hypothetical protein
VETAGRLGLQRSVHRVGRTVAAGWPARHRAPPRRLRCHPARPGRWTRYRSCRPCGRVPGSKLARGRPALRDVQDQFAVGHQPLGQRPARPAAALHRPVAALPPPGKARQARAAGVAVSEPGCLNQCLVTGPGTAAVLLALCESTAIIMSSLKGSSSLPGISGEEGSATSGRADLS